MLSGDENAFQKLYDEYALPVYEYIRFRVDNDADAADLTAEVFVKAWQALPHYESDSSGPLQAWLFRIADSSIVDKTKTGRGSAQTFQPPDFVDSKAFDTLSTEEQVIRYLAEHEGYINKQLAKILGKIRRSTGVAKFQALKHLGKAQRFLN
jgi:DNA-directed RNA polymerase specialized sigma24 family protein